MEGVDDLYVIFFLSLLSPSLVLADTKVPGAEIYILQQKHFHSPREALEGFLPDLLTSTVPISIFNCHCSQV